MRGVVLIAAIALTGCSLTTMHTVDRNWNGANPPECTSSYVPAIVDGLVGAFALGVSIELAFQEKSELAVLGTTGVALGFAVSGYIGERRAAHCGAAEIAWSTSDAPAHLAAPGAPPTLESVETFYCAVSVADQRAMFCAAYKDACVQQRKALPTRTDECEAATVAFCFGYLDGTRPVEICAATAEDCDGVRDAMLNSRPDASSCTKHTASGHE
jgi:hypothetical protein